MKLAIKIYALALIAFVSCKNTQSEKKETKEVVQEAAVFDSFGEKISSENTLSALEMYTKFSNLKAGDTLDVKYASIIKEVCTKKGCWMKLPLTENTEIMVRFKDYGFFIPLDAKDKEVVIEGKAFVTETSVKDLQHYAADAGKSKEEIAAITSPKTEFAFEAKGVLLKK